MAERQLTQGDPAGTVIGRSDEKLSFYGGTPVVKYSTSIATATDGTTAAAAVSAVLAVLEHYGLVTIND